MSESEAQNYIKQYFSIYQKMTSTQEKYTKTKKKQFTKRNAKCQNRFFFKNNCLVIKSIYLCNDEILFLSIKLSNFNTVLVNVGQRNVYNYYTYQERA